MGLTAPPSAGSAREVSSSGTRLSLVLSLLRRMKLGLASPGLGWRRVFLSLGSWFRVFPGKLHGAIA
jgi:hypothetical protein